MNNKRQAYVLVNNRLDPLSDVHNAQPFEPAANAWVRKPDGPIRRRDRMAFPPAGSLRFPSVTGPPSGSVVANANGLESQLPGSAGKLSRPAMVKVL